MQNKLAGGGVGVCGLTRNFTQTYYLVIFIMSRGTSEKDEEGRMLFEVSEAKAEGIQERICQVWNGFRCYLIIHF